MIAICSPESPDSDCTLHPTSKLPPQVSTAAPWRALPRPAPHQQPPPHTRGPLCSEQPHGRGGSLTRKLPTEDPSLSGGSMDSSCYFKCIKTGDAHSFGSPAAQPPTVAASLHQAQEAVGSAGSTPHYLWDRLMETHPSLGQPCCYANGKSGLPLEGKCPRGKSRSRQYLASPTERPTRQGGQGALQSVRCQVGRALVRDTMC